jgi:drug/metabolite transporter (DMT)-like permease
MDAKRPFVALVTLAVVASVVGAAATLVTRTVVDGGDASLPVVGALLVVALAVGVAVLVGRRSHEWVTNPDSYW